MSQLETDERLMQLALEEARQGSAEGEVPVGALLVMGDEILARAHNTRIGSHDPTGHAEILAIRQAGHLLKNYRLPGSTLYVTMEPCPMCFGAIIEARISLVVFSVREPRAGVMGSLYDLQNDPRWVHRPLVREGILKEPVRKLIGDFFTRKRLGQSNNL